MQASSLRESDGGYIRESPFETLIRSNRQTLGPARSFEKSGAVLRRKPQQPRFMLLVALSADVAAEPGRIRVTRRMLGAGRIGPGPKGAGFLLIQTPVTEDWVSALRS